MLEEVGGVAEGLAADAAGQAQQVGRVRFHVPLEALPAVEAFAAHGAGEGLLTRVDDLVLVEVAGLLEDLPAEGAGKRALPASSGRGRHGHPGWGGRGGIPIRGGGRRCRCGWGARGHRGRGRGGCGTGCGSREAQGRKRGPRLRRPPSSWWHVLVAAPVAYETGDVVVGAATDTALVRPLPGVHQHVLDQMRGLFEGLLAHAAREAALHQVLEPSEVTLVVLGWVAGCPHGGPRWGLRGRGQWPRGPGGSAQT